MTSETVRQIYNFAKILLGTFLLIDFIFLGLHYHFQYETGDQFRDFLVDRDNSYAEWFQYVKFGVVLILLGFLITKYRKREYLFWFFLFFIFLLDDSIGLHERFGWHVSKLLGYKDFYGLRAIDWGELTYVVVMGPLLFLFFVYSYKNGNKDYKKRTIDLTLFVGIFLFFGIVIDMIHSYFSGSPILGRWLTIIEDGGEMITLSFMAWYIFKFVFTLPAKKGYLIKKPMFQSILS